MVNYLDIEAFVEIVIQSQYDLQSLISISYDFFFLPQTLCKMYYDKQKNYKYNLLTKSNMYFLKYFTLYATQGRNGKILKNIGRFW